MQASNRKSSELVRLFVSTYGKEAEFSARAPGRVNLIGEHTDYNEGFVLPLAIDREITLIAAKNRDGNPVVNVYSADYQQSDTIDLLEIQRNDRYGWTNYLRGVLCMLQAAGCRIGGFDVAIAGNVPQGAGLSSSAAYEVAVATLVNRMFDLQLKPKEIALLAQKAENEFVGVACGIMDQLISATAHEDSAVLIDCRSLDCKSIPLNLEQRKLSVVITHCGVSRQLLGSEFNSRRRECQQGVKLLAQLLGRPCANLRDVTLAEFAEQEKSLPPIIARRCRHVLSENDRVFKLVSALEQNNLSEVGSLLYASHESLRDDYEVSCRELDVLVDLTRSHPGVIGTRMTGGGFGGCTVSLMEESTVSEFKSKVVSQYQEATGKVAEVFLCRPAGGASVVAL